ncbi:pre-mRNA-processing factor 39-like isoform X2 [Gigantopelta aegis]|uniref:pre-mRNA-processing factor 39-like isoform X2 n=1 Tax=Gigantopelta aegis TaxID=1735272 RepID=UPI001B888F7C|nr:pre-mRNA-processing factor 39-like isoform X2 [Gigantopelta aegis]XP_041352819.1 pre-mRNA-processing factor 39-like isoform X2 [Gigantopelta aegis]
MIFERGLKGIPLSVDLWLHYINFYITEFSSSEDVEDKTRKLYEQAIAAAGTDFRSDKLWDSYISWETVRNNYKAVTKLYDRLLCIPTQLYSHHFDNFKKHVEDHHPKEILSLDEFLKLRQEVVKDAQDGDELATEGPPGTDSPPGVDAPPGLGYDGGMSDDVESRKLRVKIIDIREAMFKRNENEVSRRWAFEEAVRRPYFHVKPLERAQLKNWREYLDFEIEHGSHERVVVLFERCMIACALYEDFWMKYAKYLEQHSIEGVQNVYRRACEIHLPKKPYIHMAWAAFEERQQNYQATRQVLINIDKNVPGLVMVAMRRISLERRQGNDTDVEKLFQDYINQSTSPSVKSFYSIKFARYLLKIKGNSQKARCILTEALERDKRNEKLFLQLIDLEYQTQPVDVDRTLEVFDRVIQNDVQLDFKVKVSQRRMEFLEDFGTDIKRITEAYDEHQKLVKDLNTDRKKKHPDQLDDSSQPPDKKQKTETINGSGDSTSHLSSTSTPDTNHAYNYYYPPNPSSSYPYHSNYANYGSQYGSYYPSY